MLLSRRYRNAEFGQPVGDPDKRGRYGRPNPPGFKVAEKNPYHYHGADVLEDKPVAAPATEKVPAAAMGGVSAAQLGAAVRPGHHHGHHGHKKDGKGGKGGGAGREAVLRRAL